MSALTHNQLGSEKVGNKAPTSFLLPVLRTRRDGHLVAKTPPVQHQIPAPA